MARGMGEIAEGIGAATAEVFRIFRRGYAPSAVARRLGMHERDVRSAVVSVWRADKEEMTAQKQGRS